jgi:sec-independent protein translocase protein TatB
MFGMSMWEILVVFALLFIVVGPGKLPGLAKTIGEQIRGLRRSLSDVKATVDKDDEFIKAVSEARQSVAEAKEAVRGILDDVVNVTEDLGLEEEVRDLAPKPMSVGRKRVSRGGADGDESSGRPKTDPTDPGPALADEPVEAEDWRASARGGDVGGADLDAAADLVDDPGTSPERFQATGDERGVVRQTTRRGATTGRRMIRPGRRRDGDGE